MDRTRFVDADSIAAIDAFVADRMNGSLSSLAREMRDQGLTAVVRVGRLFSLDSANDFGACTARIEDDVLVVRSASAVIARIKALGEDDAAMRFDPHDPDFDDDDRAGEDEAAEEDAL